jgi:hypothetical protein
MVDLEKGEAAPPTIGYAAVSKFIAADKDHSAAVYSRFEELAARDLLYRQSELSELQKQLQYLDRDDASPHTPRECRELALHWSDFLAKAAEPSPEGREARWRLKLVLEIREKLQQYRKCNLNS